MKLYTDYVKETLQEMAKKEGGYRKLGERLKVDFGYLNKASNGRIIPAPKTFSKWIGKDIVCKLYIEE